MLSGSRTAICVLTAMTIPDWYSFDNHSGIHTVAASGGWVRVGGDAGSSQATALQNTRVAQVSTSAHSGARSHADVLELALGLLKT